MPDPTTLHALAALLVIGAAVSFGWSVAAWLFGLFTLPGRIVAALVVLLALVLLVIGRV